MPPPAAPDDHRTLAAGFEQQINWVDARAPAGPDVPRTLSSGFKQQINRVDANPRAHQPEVPHTLAAGFEQQINWVNAPAPAGPDVPRTFAHFPRDSSSR